MRYIKASGPLIKDHFTIELTSYSQLKDRVSRPLFIDSSLASQSVLATYYLGCFSFYNHL